MKQIVKIVALLLALVGCGNNSTQEPGAAASAVSTTASADLCAARSGSTDHEAFILPTTCKAASNGAEKIDTDQMVSFTQADLDEIRDQRTGSEEKNGLGQAFRIYVSQENDLIAIDWRDTRPAGVRVNGREGRVERVDNGALPTTSFLNPANWKASDSQNPPAIVSLTLYFTG